MKTKKEYRKPVAEIATVKIETLMSGGSVHSVAGNAGIGFGGAGTDAARSKERGEADFEDLW